jgi:tetratricopeptide (TPR) repeat protein
MPDLAEFQFHMDEGHNAAWDHNWSAAIEAYSKAVQAKPEDPDAHINLGLALLEDGQSERALKIARRAQQLAPDDPVPLELTADILGRIGQLQEASQQYIKVSEIYLAQRDLDKAIANWERASELTPGLVSVHARLAQAYERIGKKDEAIREYLILAYNFKKMADVPKALRAIDRALSIEKNHSIALNFLQAFKSGGDVVLPPEYIKQGTDTSADGFSMEFDDARPGVGEAHPLGPIGEALDESLGLLAEFVVESGLNESVMFAMQGMEHQRQEDPEAAIDAYQQAVNAGLRHPTLKMSLGGLLLLGNQPKLAIPHLIEAATLPQLAAGAFHGLGQAYFQLGDHKKASSFLIQSLRAVDTSLAVTEQEEEELLQVYKNLLAALENQATDSLKVINEHFIALLKGKDWKQRIAQTRSHLYDIFKEDAGGIGMINYIKDGNTEVAELVANVDRYISNGLYTLAMDEAHRAVEVSPFYLAVHVRMAEIMMKEGRIRQAINKYNIVARSHMVKGQNDRAATILEEVLEMAPLDLDVRVNLIELFENEERWDEALDQYIHLAETFQQLGDFDRSSDTFEAAEELARRINAPAEKLVEIKHFIADIHQMRLNTRAAQQIYEGILEVKPDDVKALRALIDIYYTQGNQVEAVQRLDNLLGFYARDGQIQKIISLLEEMVHVNPADTAIRQRLASIYRKRGLKAEAIEQLDRLGELQLDAGLTSEAAKTIKQIISMKPDRIEDYQRLLAQLGG